MRYHYEKKKDIFAVFGETFECDHPVYSKCTLFKEGKNGLAVIQQRYVPLLKTTYWTEIDEVLVNDIFMNHKFPDFFKERSGPKVNGCYPTVSVRQIMWALRMKPLKRERWETYFDRRSI